MKRVLLYIWLATFTFIAGAVIAFDLGLFHSQIEQLVGQKTGAKVKLGKLYLLPKWPLTLDIGASQLEHSVYDVQWKSVRVELSTLLPPYAVTVTLDDPHFELKEAATQQSASSSAPAPSGSGAGLALPLRLTFNIHNGEVKAAQAHLTALDLSFEQKILLRSQASVHVKALVEVTPLPLPIPMTIDTDGLTLSPQTIKASGVKVFFAGLQADAQGTSLLDEDRHRWKVEIAAPDLSQLPKPPPDIPAQDWRGAMQMSVEMSKDGNDKNWSAEGDVLANRVSANIKYQHEKITVRGPFHLELKSHFQYLNGAATLPNLSGAADLTEARVVYQDMMDKASGVPLSFKIEAQGDPQRLQVKNLQFQFWNMVAKFNGQTALTAPYLGKIHFAIEPTRLEGAEGIFLPLAKSPVEGEVELRGSIEGPLADPRQAHLLLEAIKLKDFGAEPDYTKPGLFKIVGPIVASLDGKADIDKLQVKQMQLEGQVNLEPTALVVGPLRKVAKQQLNVSFKARNVGQVVQIDGLDVNSFLGRVKLSGKVSDLRQRAVQLSLDLQPLDLSEMRVALPEYHDQIPKGSVRGQVTLSGRVADEKPWQEWPLNVGGNVQVTIPEYKMEAAAGEKPSPKGAAKPPPANAKAAFLPSGYLTSHVKLKLAADVNSLSVGPDLQVRGIHSEGEIASGRYKGSVFVSEIFSGTVAVTGLDVPLLTARPAIGGMVKWQELVIEDVLGFAKPEVKSFATGRTGGTTEFLTYMPSDEEFLRFLRAKGALQMEPVTLNSVQVGQMINDLAKKAPMIKMQPVKVAPLKGMVKTQFDLKSQSMQIDDFIARDVDSSELQLKGKVILPSLQGDLVGTFLWARHPIRGCMAEGNSDAQGRMVIPVAIKGDLMHPGLSTLSDLISKLGAKALQCESKKLVEKVKKEGTKQLEDEVKKRLKGILGN